MGNRKKKMRSIHQPKKPFLERCKEEPAVPIGVLATTAALGYGFYTFVKGNKKQAQKAMRLRVALQFSTVLAVFVGGYFANRKRNLAFEAQQKENEQKL